jgi:16S rRNA U1498 N3-methylase RsmE
MFSEDEVFYLENEIKAQGVKLSKNILRAETASILAIGLVTHSYR